MLGLVTLLISTASVTACTVQPVGLATALDSDVWGVRRRIESHMHALESGQCSECVAQQAFVVAALRSLDVDVQDTDTPRSIRSAWSDAIRQNAPTTGCARRTNGLPSFTGVLRRIVTLANPIEMLTLFLGIGSDLWECVDWVETVTTLLFNGGLGIEAIVQALLDSVLKLGRCFVQVPSIVGANVFPPKPTQQPTLPFSKWAQPTTAQPTTAQPTTAQPTARTRYSLGPLGITDLDASKDDPLPKVSDAEEEWYEEPAAIFIFVAFGLLLVGLGYQWYTRPKAEVVDPGTWAEPLDAGFLHNKRTV